MDPSEALKAYADERSKKLIKFLAPGTPVVITLHKDHIAQIAELTFSYHGETHHAAKDSDDMYQSIDEAVDKAIHQVKKAKEKLTEH